MTTHNDEPELPIDAPKGATRDLLDAQNLAEFMASNMGRHGVPIEAAVVMLLLPSGQLVMNSQPDQLRAETLRKLHVAFVRAGALARRELLLMEIKLIDDGLNGKSS